MVKGYQTILDALSKRLEKENISEEERKSITSDMIEVTDKIAEADLNNKKFLDRIGNKVLFGAIAVVAVVGAAIGINSSFGNGYLSEIEDGEDEKEA